MPGWQKTVKHAEDTWGRKSKSTKSKTLNNMAALYTADGKAKTPQQTQLACSDSTQAVTPPRRPRGRPRKPVDANAAPKRKKVNPTLTERYEQEKVVVHCTKLNIPFFAIPNAARRTFWEAMLAKKGGMKAGVPDLCFPVPMLGYNGLWIEMKRIEGGVISPIQYYWLALLRENGYKAEVAHGAEQAIRVIDRYFEGWMGTSPDVMRMLDVINTEKQLKYEQDKADKLLQRGKPPVNADGE